MCLLVRPFLRVWISVLLLALALSLSALASPLPAQPEISGWAQGEKVVLAASSSDAGASLSGGTSPWRDIGQDRDDEGPDILFLALITAAAVLGVAVLGLLLYLVRLRIGFWLHRPPPREGSEGAEHH